MDEDDTVPASNNFASRMLLGLASGMLLGRSEGLEMRHGLELCGYEPFVHHLYIYSVEIQTWPHGSFPGKCI
jgi:hypothetical protein